MSEHASISTSAEAFAVSPPFANFSGARTVARAAKSPEYPSDFIPKNSKFVGFGHSSDSRR